MLWQLSILHLLIKTVWYSEWPQDKQVNRTWAEIILSAVVSTISFHNIWPQKLRYSYVIKEDHFNGWSVTTHTVWCTRVYHGNCVQPPTELVFSILDPIIINHYKAVILKANYWPFLSYEEWLRQKKGKGKCKILDSSSPELWFTATKHRNIQQSLARSFLSDLNANCHFPDAILLFHEKPS